MPMPNDKASVCHVLGMINFLASHIPDMISIVAPLRELIKANFYFHWNSAAEVALTRIKYIILLSTQPVLQFLIQLYLL